VSETRIHWEQVLNGTFWGRVGTLYPAAFQVIPPRQPGGMWTLGADLPGMEGRDCRDPDPDKLKAEAERWLSEFVASLGAVFPDPELPECHRCTLPITGTPVAAEDDPLHRPFCSDGCRDGAAEASHEQRYQPGVAT